MANSSSAALQDHRPVHRVIPSMHILHIERLECDIWSNSKDWPVHLGGHNVQEHGTLLHTTAADLLPQRFLPDTGS